MKDVKVSGPVAAIILAIVVLLAILIGYRAVNPKQELGPAAKAMDEAFRRSTAGQQ
jgi:xanthosine utilization system XapX-like protein